jgi:hypothetical protein
MDEILTDGVLGAFYDTRPFYSSSAQFWIGTWERVGPSHGSPWHELADYPQQL